MIRSDPPTGMNSFSLGFLGSDADILRSQFDGAELWEVKTPIADDPCRTEKHTWHFCQFRRPPIKLTKSLVSSLHKFGRDHGLRWRRAINGACGSHRAEPVQEVAARGSSASSEVVSFDPHIVGRPRPFWSSRPPPTTMCCAKAASHTAPFTLGRLRRAPDAARGARPCGPTAGLSPGYLAGLDFGLLHPRVCTYTSRIRER
jgi:hypothetical protein